MDLNLGVREVIVAMRAAHPDTGLKKLTTMVNELLPPTMEVKKYKLRDFLRSLAASADGPATAAIKPRDESFQTNTVNQVFGRFRDAEREYLLNLDSDSADGIHLPNTDAASCHPVAHLRHHFQALLVLMGFRPCVPFVSPKVVGIATVREMVLRCLVPLMEQFDLESYGFKLLYVATDVLTHDKRFHGFNGSWVLADTQSTGWRAVREIFVAMPTLPIPPKLMSGVLGFPVHDEWLANKVEILDATEHAVLRDQSSSQDSCKVGVLKIFCDEGSAADWEKIVQYYIACKDLAATFGTALTLDLREHHKMLAWCGLTGRLACSEDVSEA